MNARNKQLKQNTAGEGAKVQTRDRASASANERQSESEPKKEQATVERERESERKSKHKQKYVLGGSSHHLGLRRPTKKAFTLCLCLSFCLCLSLSRLQIHRVESVGDICELKKACSLSLSLFLEE
jgi:hypothetical protein